MYTHWSIASSAHEHESAHIAQIRPHGRFANGRWANRVRNERGGKRPFDGKGHRFESIAGCGPQQRPQAARGCDDEQGRTRSASGRVTAYHRSRRGGNALPNGYEAQNLRSARSFASGQSHGVARAPRSFGYRRPVVRRVLVRDTSLRSSKLGAATHGQRRVDARGMCEQLHIAAASRFSHAMKRVALPARARPEEV